jgi:hypothetical protein
LSIALLGLGVPLVLPLALLTFLGGFLPLVGAIVSGALAALVALVIKGPVAALIIVGVTIVIHNVEGYIVGPKVLGHEVRLHAVVIILVIAAGTSLGGIAGAFLAVPLTAILIAVYNHYHDSSRLEADDERGPPELAARPAEPTAAGAEDLEAIDTDGVDAAAPQEISHAAGERAPGDGEPAPADGEAAPDAAPANRADGVDGADRGPARTKPVGGGPAS